MCIFVRCVCVCVSVCVHFKRDGDTKEERLEAKRCEEVREEERIREYMRV